MNRRVNSEINLALSACCNLLKLIYSSYEVNKSNDTVVMIHIMYTFNKYIYYWIIPSMKYTVLRKTYLDYTYTYI